MAYDVGGGLQFTCLSNLIDHYKRNPMSEMNGEVIQLNEVILTSCVIKNEIYICEAVINEI